MIPETSRIEFSFGAVKILYTLLPGGLSIVPFCSDVVSLNWTIYSSELSGILKKLIYFFQKYLFWMFSCMLVSFCSESAINDKSHETYLYLEK